MNKPIPVAAVPVAPQEIFAQLGLIESAPWQCAAHRRNGLRCEANRSQMSLTGWTCKGHENTPWNNIGLFKQGEQEHTTQYEGRTERLNLALARWVIQNHGTVDTQTDDMKANLLALREKLKQ